MVRALWEGQFVPGRGWHVVRINVTAATAAELEALPGIGPVIARRIVEGRPYRSVEELDRVKGIGKKRLEEIRPLVTAE
jgi:competence protein ComEA